jgi:hypothetical protein
VQSNNQGVSLTLTCIRSNNILYPQRNNSSHSSSSRCSPVIICNLRTSCSVLLFSLCGNTCNDITNLQRKTSHQAVWAFNVGGLVKPLVNASVPSHRQNLTVSVRKWALWRYLGWGWRGGSGPATRESRCRSTVAKRVVA